MDLTPFVDTVRRELAVAAEAGGEESRVVAGRLIGPLDAAVRLVVQDALSDAADEITRDLAPGSVELRLRGREIGFVVTPPDMSAGAAPLATSGPPPAPEAEPTGATARITFRPSEHLKALIEQAAEREGLSVNTYLTRTLTAVLQGGGAPGPLPPPRDPFGKGHFTGWVS